MNKLPDPIQQLVPKSACADSGWSAAAFILRFQSQRGIFESIGTACFSHQFLSSNVQLFDLHPVTCDPADDTSRVKPTLTGSNILRDIAQEMVRLMSRIKETLIDCVCPASTRSRTTLSKRPAAPRMIHPGGRLQTDTTMAKMQSMCIESPSIQRLMGNTSFVV